jgi:molybdopterin molybdotransferase
MAWEILTGAPVPPGFDAVVPLERVTRVDSPDGAQAAVLITGPLEPGQNIRQCGEDFRQGQPIVAAGTRLAPHHVMALAAGGVDEVQAAPTPRVAVLTTGNELATHGAELAPGQIRDANGPYLRALLPLLGAELTTLATARDQADDLRTQLAALTGTVDIVLTTGGVSVGRLDLLPAVVRELGGEILFHKVAIRPGKPILHARMPDGTLLFGLPGNPLAVAVGMRFFVMPALRALLGMPPERESPAITMAPVRGRDQLCFFAKAYVETDATGRRRVQLLPGQESFRIAPLLRANCWAIVPEGVGEIPAGGTLATLPLYPDDTFNAPSR